MLLLLFLKNKEKREVLQKNGPKGKQEGRSSSPSSPETQLTSILRFMIEHLRQFCGAFPGPISRLPHSGPLSCHNLKWTILTIHSATSTMYTLLLIVAAPREGTPPPAACWSAGLPYLLRLMTLRAERRLCLSPNRVPRPVTNP
jgi:hypothetical protein